MALRQAGLIFRTEAAASLLFTPRAGEGFRVKSIFVANVSAASAFVTIVNDTARVGFFRIAGFGGSHLFAPRSIEQDQTVAGNNMIELMKGAFGFAGYPVVQGEQFAINVSTGTADIFAIADSVDAGDVASSMPQGSHSSDITFINYGTNLSVLSVAAYTKLDNRQNPAEMPAFPFGAPGAGLVPAGKLMHIFKIGGAPVGRFASAGNTANTQYLRPRLGTAPALTVLDRNDVGYQFIGLAPAAAGTSYTSLRTALESAPLFFNPTIPTFPEMDFRANDEFALQVSTQIVGTGSLSAGDVDVWVIERVFLPA